MLSGSSILLSKVLSLRISPLPLHLWNPCPARVSQNRCVKILIPKDLDIKILTANDLQVFLRHLNLLAPL